MKSSLRMIDHSGYRAVNGDWLAQPQQKLSEITSGSPALGFVRSDILESALDLALEKQVNVRVLDGAMVTGITTQANGSSEVEVRVKTDDGEQTLTAQLLIAADGMESRVRGWTGLHRPENDLQYRGYQVYRGVSAEPISDAFQTWGPHCRFAAVPVKVEGGSTSTEYSNGSAWFAAIAGPRSHHQPSSSSDAVAMDYPFRNGGVSVSESTLKDLRNRFRNWHHPIENILARSDLTSLSVTCALASPTTLWKGEETSGATNGPVFFVGDARVTLDPILAQGAGMAVEDAAELSKAIYASLIQKGDGDCSTAVDWSSALKRYHRSRVNRTLRLQILSDVAQVVGNLPSGSLLSLRDELLKRLPQRVTGNLFNWVLHKSVKP
eukprot:gene25459-34009_t